MTTTDLEQYADAPLATPAGGLLQIGNDSVDALIKWAEAASAAHRMAQSLVATSFVPATFKGKPGEATAAILAGIEMGLSPMAALRAFDIIQGQAAPRAITLRAVVQSKGHEVWVEEESPTRAVVKGRRRGSDKVQQSEWTIDKAKGLGLLSKDNWQKQPAAMLVARATSELCRRIASDAILGIAYSSEELRDTDTAPAATTAPAPARTDTPSRGLRAQAAARAAAPEPQVDTATGEIADPPADALLADEPEGWR